MTRPAFSMSCPDTSAGLFAFLLPLDGAGSDLLNTTNAVKSVNEQAADVHQYTGRDVDALVTPVLDVGLWDAQQIGQFLIR